ncbi:hypothetical protein DR864_00650 [Runella rosea]|uniref:Two component transcriptional regulator, LytTR family n=1 Tax=Runella rosea TaxID=2259595 RepID=A0A344TCG4_9BACT|nr:response regulator transcription factor [Runella rosea]AXE16335.1 hypothetical protein DR864_00650 [Runella rosea]
MKILIAEDDLIYAVQLEAMLSDLGYEIIGCVNTYQKAYDFLYASHVDLMLIDVVLMGSKNGLELADLVSSRNIPFILITAYDTPQIYEQVSKWNNVLYLVKPVHIHTLDSSIRILTKQSEIEPQFIRGTTRSEIISINEILYIEVDRNYTFVQTAKRRYAFKKSLSLIKQQLPLDRFLEIHRSFLVNKKFITKIDLEKSLVYVEGYMLPMSRRVKHDLIAKGIGKKF